MLERYLCLMFAVLKTGGQVGDPYFGKVLQIERQGLINIEEAMACPWRDDHWDKLEHDFPMMLPSKGKYCPAGVGLDVLDQ